MKKNVFEMVVALVNGREVADIETLRNEVNAEWERNQAKRQANRDLYDEARDALLDALTDTEQTAKELFENHEWPSDFTQGKLNYALRALWSEDVVKHDNGKNPYTYTKR